MSLFDVLRENTLSSLFANAAFFRVFTVCLLIIVGWILHGYAFIPLKQVPGPWMSRILPLQDRWGRSLQGKRLLKLHQIYGSARSDSTNFQGLLSASAHIVYQYEGSMQYNQYTVSPQTGPSYPRPKNKGMHTALSRKHCGCLT